MGNKNMEWKHAISLFDSHFLYQLLEFGLDLQDSLTLMWCRNVVMFCLFTLTYDHLLHASSVHACTLITANIRMQRVKTAGIPPCFKTLRE